jgi:DNA-binding winged helix-turn-helix (wHTH) protein
MRVVFGDCEFDSSRRLLLRHGSAMPLSLKAFQVLELLLDRRPEAVSKTELLERLWPGSFVSDASLHNAVAEIRAALGDSPQAARYIRTVPRYGYAFHGDARAATPIEMAKSELGGPRLISRSREWLLSEGSNVVGRDRDCVVRIDSPTLSRRHARIIVTSGEATIEDLGSKNGTHVNGQRVTKQTTLKDNDRLQVGSVMMRFRVLDSLPSTLTRASSPPS